MPPPVPESITDEYEAMLWRDLVRTYEWYVESHRQYPEGYEGPRDTRSAEEKRRSFLLIAKMVTDGIPVSAES